MEWTDDAIILSSYKYGESSLIVNVLTKNYGLHAGLIRSARKNNNICQPGNLVETSWKARLEEHLGNFSFEVQKSFFPLIMDDPLKLEALTSACSIIKKLLPEREPHEEIFDIFYAFLESITDREDWLQIYTHLEFEILKRLGYGLDLSACAATGKKDHLIYVSPKSGRAVCQEAGEKYKDKLLKLPRYLRPEHDISFEKTPENIREIVDGMVLTRYFLHKHIFEPHNDRVPEVCNRFVEKLQRKQN